MDTFKIGDRVVLARPDGFDRAYGLKEGMIGTLLEDEEAPYVRWDGLATGHTGAGMQNIEPGKPRDVWAVARAQLELAGEPVPAEANPQPVPAEANPQPVPVSESLLGRRIRITHGHPLAPTGFEGELTTPVVTPLADVTPGADTDEDGDYWVKLDHEAQRGLGTVVCVGARRNFELTD
jgi:hypothetical protein